MTLPFVDLLDLMHDLFADSRKSICASTCTSTRVSTVSVRCSGLGNARFEAAVLVSRFYERGCQHKHLTADRPPDTKPIVAASPASIETIC